MALAPGARLGPYEVLGLIGAGGMGEVYKARDTRLDRTVAIKILPPEVVADAARRQRFEREARAISQLTHPHICVLYDVGTAPVPDSAGAGVGAARVEAGLSRPDLPFLVMEYLEGETLAARLDRFGGSKAPPLRLQDALRIGTEIADALDHAHRHGIVHRDLKPGNIMLARSGGPSGLPTVKLLDFGLAKLKAGSGLQASGSGQTATDTLTHEGKVLGTVPYMAPEQVEGKEADARTDIFALGCVLYELVTGRRAFEGATTASLITAIMSAEPPLISVLQPLTPPVLERLVRKCLQKDPEARWQSASDVADELRWVSSGGSGTASVVDPMAARARRQRTRLQAALAVLGALLAGAVCGVLLWRSVPAPPQSPRMSMRLTITLPPDMPLAPAGLVSPAHDRPALALSPDGSRLAYVALLGGKTQICVRDMQTGTVTPLPHTAGGHTPFFSPDGTWIGFFADNKLKKIPLRGGEPIVLADAPQPWGATWGSDDTIYFNRFEGEGVFRVSADGGAVQPVVEEFGFMPEFMAEGPRLLFVGRAGVSHVDLRRPSDPRPVVSGTRARYLSSGHLVYSPGPFYSSGTTLMVVPLDAATMAPTADAVTLFEDLRTADFAVAQFTVSNEGTLVYVPGRSQCMASFVWVDRKGTQEPLGLPEACYEPPALSPDGTRLAYALGGNIWIWDRARRTSSRLTPRVATGTTTRDQFPCWTPDGKAVIYTSYETHSRPRLMAARLDGSGSPTELWAPADVRFFYPMGFSPDGSVLSFFSTRRTSSLDLLLMQVTVSGGSLTGSEPELFLGTNLGESLGLISPDGHWMLFMSDRSGAYEIWATSYPKAGPMFKLSDNGGREAMWNPAVPGEVVYLNGRAMYAVDVSRGPANAGKPQFLFDGPYPDIWGLGYDMAPDGRFLMLESKEILRPATTLVVVTNVLDELRRRVPPAKR